eukprot:TRINITY_DN1883_c0_g2_i2.p1 TRINITY_DN1883_c0_g2~~TRINITY_DN1883_c0_g2_i2.p1  ORF type:complete len:638 (-),score=153.13 TRINITY_DN1883_c0_g2_i2:457-2370(-)
MRSSKVTPMGEVRVLSSATSLGDLPKPRTLFGLRISLRVVLIVFSVSMVSAVVLACLLPTALLWWTSLSSLSDVAESTTDNHLTTYRASVVSSVTDRLSQLLRSPVMVAQLLAKEAALLPLMTHSSGELEAELQRLFIPLYSAEFWPFVWSMQIAWQDNHNCQHQFRRIFKLSDSGLAASGSYGIWDPCDTTMMHFWYYNGSSPTKVLQNNMTLLTLNNRAWWARPHDPALLKDNAAWCPPFISATPGEGKLITVSYAFPAELYDRSSTSFPISMSAFKIDGLNDYLTTIKHSANGWIMLVEGSNYNLVASSRAEYIPAANASMPALSSPYAEVRDVVHGWIGAGQPNKTSLPGDVLLDVVSVAVPGGGIDFRLFLVTPRQDFLGDISSANKQQMNTARSTLVAVIASEVAILVLAFIASVAISVVLSRPLLNIKEQLFHIGNMDLELVRANSSYSLISEVSKLQIEAHRMSIALDSFAKYVPRLVVKDLLRKQRFAQVGVNETNAVILFLDIVDFTKTMDNRGAAVVIEILKLMFERFSQIITSNKGVIDKYIGDSIMAIWGAPEPVDQPVDHASNALDQILAELIVINGTLQSQFDLSMRVRIGMHYGQVWYVPQARTHIDRCFPGLEVWDLRKD